MRVLFSSTRGTGHFRPLLPFMDAFRRAGHDVLAAGPPELTDQVAAAGHDFWRFDPPSDAIQPLGFASAANCAKAVTTVSAGHTVPRGD